MFYSFQQRYRRTRAITPLCKSPVQFWLGPDNGKPAWRGDTTPQDVMEAIIILCRRDVWELVPWWRGRNTSRPGAAWRHVDVLWCSDVRANRWVDLKWMIGMCTESFSLKPPLHTAEKVLCGESFGLIELNAFCIILQMQPNGECRLEEVAENIIWALKYFLAKTLEIESAVSVTLKCLWLWLMNEFGNFFLDLLRSFENRSQFKWDIWRYIQHLIFNN